MTNFSDHFHLHHQFFCFFGSIIYISVFVFMVAIGLSACSSTSILPKQKAVYKNSQSLPPLEVPPQLSAPEIDETLALPAPTPAANVSSGNKSSAVELAAAPSKLLLRPEDVEVKHYAGQRWLVIKAPADQVWSKTREYWLQAGFVLKVENEKIGILETDWVENRADIPTDPVRRTLGKALDMLYSAPTRDKFRIRLEKINATTTELYLTHRGMAEVVHNDQVIWQSRPADPELEAEMLNRMLAFWGGKEQQATASTLAVRSGQPSARLMGDGANQWLQLEQDFDTAWRLVGLALERGHFLVEERDYEAAIYRVRYADPLQDNQKPGWLSRMGLVRKKENALTEQVYPIQLARSSAGVKITVLADPAVKNASAAVTRQRILELLKEQL